MCWTRFRPSFAVSGHHKRELQRCEIIMYDNTSPRSIAATRVGHLAMRASTDTERGVGAVRHGQSCCRAKEACPGLVGVCAAAAAGTQRVAPGSYCLLLLGRCAKGAVHVIIATPISSREDGRENYQGGQRKGPEAEVHAECSPAAL